MLKFAWRNIWRNKVRSLLIMATVALGLFAGIFVQALYEGMMRARVRAVIDTEVAHLQIHHPKFKNDQDPAFVIPGRDTIRQRLMEIPSVHYVALRSVTQGMLSTATGSSGVKIFGVIPSDENKVSRLQDKIIEGVNLDPNKHNEVVIGHKLADKMKLRLGSKLVLTFTDRDQNITAGAFRIVGIYRTNNAPLDELQVYVNRATLDGYLAIGNACHEVAIILTDDKLLASARDKVQAAFPHDEVRTWKENSPETSLMVTTIDQFSYVIVTIIMIALAFGIVNTMLMAVLERTRELGMLTALGMNRRKVFQLVLLETVLLTLVGVPLGFVATLLAVNYLSGAGIDISSFSGEAMTGYGFSSIIYPEFPWRTIPGVLSIVAGTAVVSSVFPSLRAIRLQPADALRM